MKLSARWSLSAITLAMVLMACSGGTSGSTTPTVSDQAPAVTVGQPSDPLPPAPTLEEIGNIDTSLGEFRWRHLTGTSGSLPYPDGGVVATSSGFLAISYEPDPSTGDLTEFRFWRTRGGLEWASEDLPVPIEPSKARLQDVGGDAWLITVSPDTLWRSSDGANWAQMPVPKGASLDRDSLVGASDTWLIGGGLWRLDGASWTVVDNDTPDEWIEVPDHPARDGVAPTKRGILTDGEVYAVFVEQEYAGPFRRLLAFSSTNGDDWKEPEVQGFPYGNDYLSLIQHEDVVLAETDYSGMTEVVEASADDFTAPEGASLGEIRAGLTSVDFGYGFSAASPGGWPDNRRRLLPGIVFEYGGVYVDTKAQYMWVSNDMSDWVGRLDISTVSMKTQLDEVGRGLKGFGAGNMIFFVVTDDRSGEREMWVWDFQE